MEKYDISWIPSCIEGYYQRLTKLDKKIMFAKKYNYKKILHLLKVFRRTKNETTKREVLFYKASIENDQKSFAVNFLVKIYLRYHTELGWIADKI